MAKKSGTVVQMRYMLPLKAHKKLRIMAALAGQTMAEYTADLVTAHTKDVESKIKDMRDDNFSG